MDYTKIFVKIVFIVCGLFLIQIANAYSYNWQYDSGYNVYGPWYPVYYAPDYYGSYYGHYPELGGGSGPTCTDTYCLVLTPKGNYEYVHTPDYANPGFVDFSDPKDVWAYNQNQFSGTGYGRVGNNAYENYSYGAMYFGNNYLGYPSNIFVDSTYDADYSYNTVFRESTFGYFPSYITNYPAGNGYSVTYTNDYVRNNDSQNNKRKENKRRNQSNDSIESHYNYEFIPRENNETENKSVVSVSKSKNNSKGPSEKAIALLLSTLEPIKVDAKPKEDQLENYVPSCNSIEIKVDSFTAKIGETNNAPFKVRNNSMEDFYVDYINTYSFDNAIKVYKNKSTYKINSNGEMKDFSARIIPNENSSYSLSNVKIKVSGHFKSGKVCGDGDIQSKGFSVYVKPTDNISNDVFNLSVPNSIQSSDISFLVKVSNPFDESLVVELKGNKVNIYPNVFVVSKKQLIEKTINIEKKLSENSSVNVIVRKNGEQLSNKIINLSSEISGIEVQSYTKEIDITKNSVANITVKNLSQIPKEIFASIEGLDNEVFVEPIKIQLSPNATSQIAIKINSKKLNLTSKNLKLVLTSGGVKQEILIKLVGKDLNVQLKTLAVPLGEKEYRIDVEVFNNSNKTIKGKLNIDAPNGWSLSNAVLVKLNPQEKRTISVTLRSGKSVDESLLIPVSFLSEDGKSWSSEVFIMSNKRLAVTGLVALSQTGLLLGLIIMLMIMGYSVLRPQSDLVLFRRYRQNPTHIPETVLPETASIDELEKLKKLVMGDTNDDLIKESSKFEEKIPKNKDYGEI